MSLRIGIDVGDTNTDAVRMDGLTVVNKIKTPTTPEVTTGITTALQHILQSSGTATSEISGVMIGTTHFTNAVVERKRLEPTAAVRLGLPATLALPPMVDWPDDLAQVLGRHTYLCHGGHEFDGREISPLDPDEIGKVAKEISGKKITAIAVSSVFSPVNTSMEQEAAAMLQEQVPGAHVTLSSDIGRVGLLERENAAILNACLRPLARETISAFRQSIADLGITAPLYITQNDGTLMSADYAEQYPVLTFASGPTNSMRGAAYLTGLKDAIVVDIGGTTSDVGMLVGGFPREAGVAVEIGGARTNFRMPDLLTIGLGGGSVVRTDPLSVGPDSVGFRLTDEALAFGGRTFTATDAAVSTGAANLGDPERVDTAARQHASAVMDLIRDRLAQAIDQVKT